MNDWSEFLRLGKEVLISLIPLFLVPSILGWGMMICLFEFLGAMGVKMKKDKKLRCWIYTSCILFLFAVLIQTFSGRKD